MGSTIYSAPRSAWALLIVALFAVSSAGAVLQSMTEVPPILRASWRMQGTALILLPEEIERFIQSFHVGQHQNFGRYLESRAFGCLS